MSLVPALLAPLALLLPGVAASEGDAPAIAESHYRPEPAHQVRIEQRVTIRIAPRPAPVHSNVLANLPARAVPRGLVEKRMGRCLPVSGIAGVQAAGGGRLILFMRDRRMVSAALERTCRARDFYSGFYLERSTDGRLCIDRDTLQSRSGVNCRVTRLRQLVADDD